jgi:anti-sigma regulatory factor (Ser/Thr protein kinase)
MSSVVADFGHEWPSFDSSFDRRLLAPFRTGGRFSDDEGSARLRRPDLVLLEPTLGHSRRALNRLSARCWLDEGDVETLLLATTELLTNAALHGMPPVVLRAWGSTDRVLVAVSDLGAGPPARPVPLPASVSIPGSGLALVRAMCDAVAFTHTSAGFTAWALTMAGRDAANPA